MAQKRKFKRGDRVRYVGDSWPGFNGVSGTVTGYDAWDFLRIRFDNQPSYEKGIQCGEVNIELYDGPPTAEPAEQFIARFTDKEKEAICDAVSNSDMDGDMRISILDRLQGRRIRKETVNA